MLIKEIYGHVFLKKMYSQLKYKKTGERDAPAKRGKNALVENFSNFGGKKLERRYGRKRVCFSKYEVRECKMLTFM